MKNIFHNISLLITIICFATSCTTQGGSDDENEVRDLQQIMEVGKLRVITMYGPISYFNYKDNVFGFEYELARRLCHDLGVTMEVILAPDEASMVNMLLNGEGDLIACRLPYTVENKSKVAFTKREYITNQVVVQCKSDTVAKDVLDLVGKSIYVVPNTIYSDRIVALNNEVGGGINVIYAEDSLSVDELIAQTAMHIIPMTVANNDVSHINKTYFSNLNDNLSISFPQRSAWAVNVISTELLAYINEWSEMQDSKLYFTAMNRKYFEKSKYFESQGLRPIPKGDQISQYDDLFRKYCKIPGWDWRLIAALCYKESHFNPDVVSWVGARGLMQLMPSTAESLGLIEDDFHDPEMSVRAGCVYLKKLQEIFVGIEDEDERVKFTLASYNSGPGHIIDARALAVKYGKNPDVWDDNVELYIKLKAEPEYYTDSICKFGYCRGSEVTDYVSVIMSKYNDYLLWAKP